MNKHMLHTNILILIARLDRKLGKYSPLIPLANRWVEKMPRSSFGLRYYGFVVETRDWVGPFMTYKSVSAELSRSMDQANQELWAEYKGNGEIMSAWKKSMDEVENLEAMVFCQSKEIDRLEAEIAELRASNPAPEWF